MKILVFLAAFVLLSPYCIASEWTPEPNVLPLNFKCELLYNASSQDKETLTILTAYVRGVASGILIMTAAAAEEYSYNNTYTGEMLLRDVLEHCSEEINNGDKLPLVIAEILFDRVARAKEQE